MVVLAQTAEYAKLCIFGRLGQKPPYVIVIPVILVLGIMFYWLFRVYKGRAILLPLQTVIGHMQTFIGHSKKGAGSY